MARAFAVLPAAGRSVRMGKPKLLLPWGDDGRTVVEQVLDTWRRSRVDVVVVTVHPDDAELAAVCRAAGAEVVVPGAPPPDMKASILAGLRHLEAQYHPQPHDLWLTAPADLPLLRSATIDTLLATAESRPGVVLRPTYGGKYGHPTAWPWSAAPEVARLAADEGLNALFTRLQWESVAAAADCVAGDVDTPDDYRLLRDLRNRYEA